MAEVNGVIDRYFAIWNETDAAQRQNLIAKTYAPDATYLDPLVSGDGHEGIDTMVAAVQGQFPGFQFQLNGAIDSFRDRVRYQWELVSPAGGDPVAGGVDFCVVAADGRLRSVTGFLDYAPAGIGAA